MAGRVEVICGCMFAGKTGLLIDRLRAARSSGLQALAIKHHLDLRYEADDLCTHDGKRFPARGVFSAAEIDELAPSADVLGIDETQFFGDEIVQLCLKWRGEGRRVILAGIDHNAWGRPFEPLPSLKIIADRVDPLFAPCTACGSPAPFTQRTTPVCNGDMVGGPSDYSPRCRDCFVPLAC